MLYTALLAFACKGIAQELPLDAAGRQPSEDDGQHRQVSEPHNGRVARHRSLKVLPVPALGYTPETGFYTGAVCLFTMDFYNDSLTRRSNAKLEFNYTWRRQLILESSWNYFFRHERWFTQGLLRFSRYPDLYFGIGETSSEEAQIHYQSTRRVADFNLLRDLGRRFFIGPQLRYLDYSVDQHEHDFFFPELRSSVVKGAGYTLLRDSRDNLLNASKGLYLKLNNTYNLYEQSVYIKLGTDMRGYLRPFKTTVAALRFYNEWTVGDPPFFDYALMGGDQIARGYFYGRYREKNLSTLQGEVRSHLFWRIGLAAFGGFTKLYADAHNLNLRYIKPNYGGGIRFLIDRKDNINLRFDYAVGIGGQTGFYISFGESF
jgi:hypothetical protein